VGWLRSLVGLTVSATVLAGLTSAEPRSAESATILAVDSPLDEPDAAPGDGRCVSAPSGQCTLRAAVQESNASSGEDTISVPAGSWMLNRIGSGEDIAATGDLDVVGVLNITGAGAPQTILDGNFSDRVFDVRPGAVLRLSGLTIQNGNAGVDHGGAIRSLGSLVVTDAALTANSAPGSQGGAIASLADLVLSRVAIYGNTAEVGGGLLLLGAGTVENTTLSLNVASEGGGGVASTGGVQTLTNVTLRDNSAPHGRNLAIQNGTVRLGNSILAGPSGGGNCQVSLAGALISLGYNLSSDGDCGLLQLGDLQNNDPLLGPLIDNGGPTRSHALAPGSPAVDAANPALCPAVDQRGPPFSRPVDGNNDGIARCDIGAAEYQAVSPIATSPGSFTAGSTLTPTPDGTTSLFWTPELIGTPTATSKPTKTPTLEPTLTPTKTPKSTSTATSTPKTLLSATSTPRATLTSTPTRTPQSG
jgi:hypothetical protein